MTAGDDRMEPTVGPWPGASRREADRHPVTGHPTWRSPVRCSMTWGCCDDFPGFSHVCRLTPPDHPQSHRCVCGESE